MSSSQKEATGVPIQKEKLISEGRKKTKQNKIKKMPLVSASLYQR